MTIQADCRGGACDGVDLGVVVVVAEFANSCMCKVVRGRAVGNFKTRASYGVFVRLPNWLKLKAIRNYVPRLGENRRKTRHICIRPCGLSVAYTLVMTIARYFNGKY